MNVGSIGPSMAGQLGPAMNLGAAVTAPATGGQEAAPAAGQQAAGAAGSSQVTAASLNTLSVNASSESLVATYGGSLSNNDLMGALLLMLTLEYLKSNDPKEKQNILSVLGTLLQQGGGAGGAGGGGGGSGGTLAYSSSSLSIESSSLQVVSTNTGLGAYTGTNIAPTQAPGVDAGSAGLDVIA